MVWGSLWMPSIPDSPFPWGFWPSGWKRRSAGASQRGFKRVLGHSCCCSLGIIPAPPHPSGSIPVGASRWPGALGARGPGVSTASGQRPQRVTSAAPAPGEDVGLSGRSARPGRGNPSEKRWNPSRSRHREAAEGAGAAAPGDLGDPQAATSAAIRENPAPNPVPRAESRFSRAVRAFHSVFQRGFFPETSEPWPRALGSAGRTLPGCPSVHRAPGGVALSPLAWGWPGQDRGGTEVTPGQGGEVWEIPGGSRNLGMRQDAAAAAGRELGMGLGLGF